VPRTRANWGIVFGALLVGLVAGAGAALIAKVERGDIAPAASVARPSEAIPSLPTVRADPSIGSLQIVKPTTPATTSSASSSHVPQPGSSSSATGTQTPTPATTTRKASAPKSQHLQQESGGGG
jgi:hypothetical protein